MVEDRQSRSETVAALIRLDNRARAPASYVTELANRLSERMLDFAHERLFAQRNKQWIDAYLRSGKGSTFDRARIIAD